MAYPLSSSCHRPAEQISSAILSTSSAGGGPGPWANITYQWQKDGVDVTNPNGNTNVFSIGSAAVSDTGNYRMIATTPYGLSATSAAAFPLGHERAHCALLHNATCQCDRVLPSNRDAQRGGGRTCVHQLPVVLYQRAGYWRECQRSG